MIRPERPIPMKHKTASTISISGHVFELRPIKGLCADDGSPLRGQCWHDKRQIAYDPAMTTQQKKETVLHETLHEILFLAGYSEDSMNEGMVTALANGLESVRINGKPLLR